MITDQEILIHAFINNALPRPTEVTPESIIREVENATGVIGVICNQLLKEGLCEREIDIALLLDNPTLPYIIHTDDFTPGEMLVMSYFLHTGKAKKHGVYYPFRKVIRQELNT